MDLTSKVLNIKGEPESLTYGQHLADRLFRIIGESEEETQKLYSWALKLYNNDPVTLTKEDREYLIKLVVEFKLPVGIAAPVLTYLRK